MGDDSSIVAVAGKLADVARPIAESGAQLIENLLGKPCAVAGDLLADQIYAWQWSNRIRIAHKAQEALDKQKVASKVLPPGFLLPLLDAAGNIDDESLQELWANLLASGVQDDTARHPAFIHTLKQMSPSDAEMFQHLEKQGNWNLTYTSRRRRAGSRPPWVFARYKRDPNVENLIALGLVRHQTQVDIEELKLETTPVATISEGQPELTGFGRAFAKAVLSTPAS